MVDLQMAYMVFTTAYTSIHFQNHSLNWVLHFNLEKSSFSIHLSFCLLISHQE